MNSSTIAIFLASCLGLSTGCQKDSGPVAPSVPQTASGIYQEAEPNDATPQAIGALGASDIVVNGTMANGTDVDKYSISLTSVANLLAKVTWQGVGDLDLTIMSSNGIPMTIRDTGANPESCVLPGQSASAYVIQVTTKTGTATSYSLTIGPR
jgi:hypothetical protein